MDIVKAAVLGLVQGLTEFLPISSSGHLLILQKAFGISTEGDGMILFTILLHLGTLAAVLVVYWDKLLWMLIHPVQSELRWLVFATIPTVIAALLLDFSDAFRGEFIVWSFFLTSIVLVAGSMLGKMWHNRRMVHKHMHWYNALGMGIMQALSILPGLSRSGSTISGGLATGLSRKHSADFAFLMSVPAICGSVILEGKDIIGMEFTSDFGTMEILVGVLIAGLSGFLAIKFMLKIIRKISLNWFALYTFLLGSLLLLDKYVFKMFMA